MLNVEDARSWFAIAALAVALIFMAGSAHGALRGGYHAGGGQYVDQTGRPSWAEQAVTG